QEQLGPNRASTLLGGTQQFATEAASIRARPDADPSQIRRAAKHSSRQHPAETLKRAVFLDEPKRIATSKSFAEGDVCSLARDGVTLSQGRDGFQFGERVDVSGGGNPDGHGYTANFGGRDSFSFSFAPAASAA